MRYFDEKMHTNSKYFLSIQLKLTGRVNDRLLYHLRICGDSCPAKLRCQPIDTLHVATLEGIAGDTLSGHVVSCQEGVLQRFDKMEILDTTLRTGNCLTVVREEIESLLRMDNQLAARVTLKLLV